MINYFLGSFPLSRKLTKFANTFLHWILDCITHIINESRVPNLLVKLRSAGSIPLHLVTFGKDLVLVLIKVKPARCTSIKLLKGFHEDIQLSQYLQGKVAKPAVGSSNPNWAPFSCSVITVSYPGDQEAVGAGVSKKNQRKR